MAAPSPIHRDPDADGDDFGCVGRKAAAGNKAIFALVRDIQKQLKARKFTTSDDLVDFIYEGMVEIDDRYDCGCLDTIVKENVFAELHEGIQNAGLSAIEMEDVYGW